MVTRVNPPRIFLSTWLTFGILHRLHLFFQNRRKRSHLEAIYVKADFITQKNLKWPDTAVFYRLHARCFLFYRLPQTPLPYCISVPMCVWRSYITSRTIKHRFTFSGYRLIYKLWFLSFERKLFSSAVFLKHNNPGKLHVGKLQEYHR